MNITEYSGELNSAFFNKNDDFTSIDQMYEGK